ncbi:hypothetical protein LLEC1_02799 [Akanthomyces lecanii]|uniref:Uncharacterized protein n=1 Tax=Cordyceps confragosa TaxID=2714763 RepID=A0A179IFE8_CORDF|nr:hypothetical protein LLEC1_02799 [Akanthomyces lecanii]
MRPSSSHTTQVPPDDPQPDDDGQHSRSRSRLLTHHANDSGSDSDCSSSSNDNSLSRHQPARHLLLCRSAGASSPANVATRMTAASVEGPGVPSASRLSQAARPSSQPEHDAQADIEMTDSDGQASDTEVEVGGAPLALTAHANNIMPPPESDSESLSDADQDDYDDDDDDEEDEEVDDDDYDSDDDMPFPQNYPNTLPPMPSPPLFPHPGNAYLFQTPPPNMPFNQSTLPVQPLNFAMPNGPTDLANLPPLPQPPPNWVTLPAFITDQNLTISNGNSGVLGSENLDLAEFLRDWAYQGRYGRAARSQPPLLDELVRQRQEQPDEIDYDQLKGDQYDLQGLNWASMETTRKAARLRRQYTYRNYVNRMGSDKWMASLLASS